MVPMPVLQSVQTVFTAGPHGALVILEQQTNKTVCQTCAAVVFHPAVRDARYAIACRPLSDPDTAITRGENFDNRAFLNRRALDGRPSAESHTVESHEACIGAEPQVAGRVFSNRPDASR